MSTGRQTETSWWDDKDWLKVMLVTAGMIALVVIALCVTDNYFRHNRCLQAGYSDVKKYGGIWYCVRLQDGHLYGTTDKAAMEDNLQRGGNR